MKYWPWENKESEKEKQWLHSLVSLLHGNKDSGLPVQLYRLTGLTPQHDDIVVTAWREAVATKTQKKNVTRPISSNLARSGVFIAWFQTDETGYEFVYYVLINTGAI